MSIIPIVPPDAAAPALADAASAEAWDAWFRWRTGNRPHDVVVADTWQRVAGALAALEPDRAAAAREFVGAMQNLQVLPDPRVLAGAGCGTVTWPPSGLHAAVNIAALVRDPFTAQARLDYAALARSAATAVRMLDAAARLASAASEAPTLRIGPIGCADALLMLRQRYDSAEACATASRVAATLAAACWTESVRLAAERGACKFSAEQRARIAAKFPPLGDDIARYGARHAALTALDAQPQLALLANNVADAAAPLRGEAQWIAIDAADGTRRVRSSGTTLTRYAALHAAGAVPPMIIDTAATLPAHASAALVAAMQPWTDA